MFCHFQRQGKCEWFAGGLNEFISHYNREFLTNYALTECLDVIRIGGTTPKNPEVLVTDSVNAQRMVIERKSVVWPPDYIRRHEIEHDFAKAMWDIASGCFQDACYELTICGLQAAADDNRTVKEIAHDIGSTIVRLPPSDLPLRGSSPVHWVFRQADVYEYGERKGIVVVHEDSMSFEVVSDDIAKAGTTAAMQEQLAGASKKFESYSDARRVTLLDFYGTDLWEDDIPPLLPKVTIPPNIDEIWMSKREWTSEDEFEIGYERLFIREAAQS
jgi:hypothetical protein